MPLVRSPFLRTLTVLAAALAVALGACATTAAPSCPPEAACLRVLFLGNSYTYVNDLPATFRDLAVSGGHDLETAMVASGGETLAQHAASAETAAALESRRWSFVVLQEQSQIPAAEGARTSGMVPAARSLAAAIRRAGSQPVLLMTWAHRDGWPEAGLAGYAAMQARIERAYLDLGAELHVAVAPVGDVWSAVSEAGRETELWQADGSHPSPAGTYLAACVLYATVFRQSPAGLPYLAGLPDTTARRLQAAAGAVLTDRGRWDRR